MKPSYLVPVEPRIEAPAELLCKAGDLLNGFARGELHPQKRCSRWTFNNEPLFAKRSAATKKSGEAVEDLSAKSDAESLPPSKRQRFAAKKPKKEKKAAPPAAGLIVYYLY